MAPNKGTRFSVPQGDTLKALVASVVAGAAGGGRDQGLNASPDMAPGRKTEPQPKLQN